jgi:ATP-binding cassette, subfamily G (WHITE), member 1
MLMLGFAAQSLGLIASSMLNVKFTLILGSFFMCPFVLFSNFFIHMKDSEEIFHVFFNLSFIKYAFDGSMQAIFGFEREKMNCSKEYCHFQNPQKFLEFLDVRENFYAILAKLFVFTLVFRFIALAVMNIRLKR